MKLFDTVKKFFSNGKYKGVSDAIIISCYHNSQKNPYRLSVFKEYYETIKHLNHMIIECVIGDDASAELLNVVKEGHYTQVATKNLLWHKETLLNKLIKHLPHTYAYVFWVDADVIFTNKNWIPEAIEELQSQNIVQLFEYCIHLEKDELTPNFDVNEQREWVSDPKRRHPSMWASFGSNQTTPNIGGNKNYDVHGHVGFAWGSHLHLLKQCPLYDRALIGGADHIMAHAAAGQIPHPCITKAFIENIEEIEEWSKKFFKVMRGKVGFVHGDLYHLWHGDVVNRQYLKRIQEFNPKITHITERDENGFFKTPDDSYVKTYFDHRENTEEVVEKPIYQGGKSGGGGASRTFDAPKKDDDGNFLTSAAIAYATNSTLLGGVMGGNFAGAMVGDMLNDSENQHTPNSSDGSASATERTWDATPVDSPADNSTEIESQNFS